MNEEALIKNKITDLANKAYRQNCYTYSNFLSISELSHYNNMYKELSFINGTTFGGLETSERQIVRFGDPEELGYEEDYPITVLKISPLIDKFAEVLNHRDYLGALMNLGIERELIGDILIKDKNAYIFCISHIAEYIISNLTKVKHNNIKCEIISNESLSDIRPTIEEIEFIVASARTDATVSALTKLSRSKAVELFRTGKIFINGMCCENNSYQLKIDDILVIRGYGKYIFKGESNQTRKGKVYIKMLHYV